MHQYDFYSWFTETYLKFSTEENIGRIEFEVLNIFMEIYQTDLEQPQLLDMNQLFRDYLLMYRDDPL
jgi:hypothetical protein